MLSTSVSLEKRDKTRNTVLSDNVMSVFDTLGGKSIDDFLKIVIIVIIHSKQEKELLVSCRR